MGPQEQQSEHFEELAHERTVDLVDDPLHHEVGVLPEDENYKFTFGIFMAIVALQIGYASAVFAIQMVSVNLQTINKDIGPSTQYAWLATAQVVPVGVLSPMVGRLGDIFGRRNFFIVGNISGVIGCLMGANAHKITTAIGGGVFIGIATAMQQTAWTALCEVVPRKHRGWALGLFETSVIIPAAFGPIIGTALAAGTTWRAVYWLCFAQNLLGVVMVFLFYHPKNQYIREEGKTPLQELADLDWIGVFLWGAGILLILLGISFGGTLYAWKSAAVICLIVIGFLLLIALFFYERYAKLIFPLFPGHVLGKTRGVTMVLIGIFLFGMLYYSTAVLWPQQVGALYTTDPLKIGWYSCTLGMAGIAISPVVGYLFTWQGHQRWIFTIIIGIGTLASGLMSLVSPHSAGYSTFFVAMLGICVGGGMTFSVPMVNLAVDHEYIGISTAMTITARNVGGAVAQTIYVAIFSNKLTSNFVTFVATPLAYAGVPLTSLEVVVGALAGELPASDLASLTPAQLEVGLNGVKNAYANALRLVYLVSIAFGIIGVAAAAATLNVDQYKTERVDIKLVEGAKITAEMDDGNGYKITQAQIDLIKSGGKTEEGKGHLSA